VAGHQGVTPGCAEVDAARAKALAVEAKVWAVESCSDTMLPESSLSGVLVCCARGMSFQFPSTTTPAVLMRPVLPASRCLN